MSEEINTQIKNTNNTIVIDKNECEYTLDTLVCLICNKNTPETAKHQCEFRKVTPNLVVKNEN